MSEDYLIEEEEEGGGSAGNRTFSLLAGIATAILLLGLLCIGAVLLLRPAADNGQLAQVAAIETQNAIIAVTNEAVTRTIEAMETEAAQPTNTPTSTPEPSPTSTPEPTNTPVVLAVDDDDDEATDDELGEGDVGTPDALATAIAEAQDGDADDPDTDNGTTTMVTPISPAGSDTTTGVDTLPDTGINTLAVIIAAFMLLGLSVAARRLRTG